MVPVIDFGFKQSSCVKAHTNPKTALGSCSTVTGHVAGLCFGMDTSYQPAVWGLGLSALSPRLHVQWALATFVLSWNLSP